MLVVMWLMIQEGMLSGFSCSGVDDGILRDICGSGYVMCIVCEFSNLMS